MHLPGVAKLGPSYANLKLSWEKGWGHETNCAPKLIGLIVGALAISLGAPFWFHILQHFMAIREAEATPKKKAEQ
jgi:hypothetical protein